MTERNQPDFAAAAKRLFGRRVEELGAIERDVLSHAAHGKPVSRDTNQAFEGKLTLGARVADRVAAFGGSWTFIIGFLISWPSGRSPTRSCRRETRSIPIPSSSST